MTKPNLTFYLEEEVDDYCGMCQQLGPPQFGVKMHRSLPAQVFWVQGVGDETPEDKKYFTLCADCLYEAHKSDEVKAIYKENKLWDPQTSKMFFIRNQVYK